jgi:excisionase family DNA binding protein
VRIRTKAAAEMLGIAPRTVQAMVARGMLPGAAKIGGVYTFDRDKLTRYLETEEAKCRKSTCTSADKLGCEPPLTGENIARAYDAAMSKLLGKDETKAPKFRKR